MQTVRDRAHRVTDDERVGVIVKENGYTERSRGQLTALGRTGPLHDLIDDPLHAAILGNNAHHTPDHERKQDDSRLARIRERPKDKDLIRIE